MRFGGLLKTQLRYFGLVMLGFCAVVLTASSAQAAGGSWGSSLGGFGCGGGLLGGRAPVRNLLGRLNSSVGNLGSNLGGGSRGNLLSGRFAGGSQGRLLGGGSVGGGSVGNGEGGLLNSGIVRGLAGRAINVPRQLLGNRFGGSVGGFGGFASGGSVGGYYSGSPSSYSYSSLGSLVAPSYVAIAPGCVQAAPYIESTQYVSAPIYSAPTYDLPSYDYSSFNVASPLANCVVDQSYPVGDYGFEPGYPIEQYSTPLDLSYPSHPASGGFSLSGSPFNGGMGGGFPIEGSVLGSGLGGGFPVEGSVVGDGSSTGDPLGSTTIIDGGSIDSMLESSAMPLDTGLDLNVPTPAGGGSEYYDGLGPGDGSVPPAGEPGLPGPASDDGTFLDQRPQDAQAVLNLILPQDAKVLINGKVTKTRGSRRSYVSRRLSDMRDYKYQVKAIVMRDGKEIVRSKMVSMRPGVDQTVKLDFEDTVTTLALRVPADAKVKLCGKLTEQTGNFRSFTTSNLSEGKTWKSYTVSVEYAVGGKKCVEERTLDLQAGQRHELAIGIDVTDSQIAAK